MKLKHYTECEVINCLDSEVVGSKIQTGIHSKIKTHLDNLWKVISKENVILEAQAHRTIILAIGFVMNLVSFVPVDMWRPRAILA